MSTKPSLLFLVHPSNRLSVCKLSDIATITNFSIRLPSSTGNPGIIPSDDQGEALSVSSKDIHIYIWFRPSRSDTGDLFPQH